MRSGKACSGFTESAPPTQEQQKPTRTTKQRAVDKISEVTNIQKQSEPGESNPHMRKHLVKKKNEQLRKTVSSFRGEPQFNVTDATIPHAVKEYRAPSLWDQKACKECGAIKFPNEPPGFCCGNGKIKWDQKEMPAVLKQLLEGDKDFVSKIRLYNNSLCLATWGVEGGKEKIKDSWSNFKFQGRCYHQVGPLKPEEGEDRRFAQWYIYDGSAEEEAQGRIDSMPEEARGSLKRETVMKLQEMIHSENRLVKMYKMICELDETQFSDMKFVLTETGRPAGTHQGTYNLPTADEIALVKLDDSLEPGDVQIHLRGGGVKRINHMNKESDCLHYTLLFPQGQDTWHKELKNSQGQKITSAVFYRHLFQVFKDSFNGLLRYDVMHDSLKIFVFYYVSAFQVWQANAGVCLHMLVQN